MNLIYSTVAQFCFFLKLLLSYFRRPVNCLRLFSSRMCDQSLWLHCSCFKGTKTGKWIKQNVSLDTVVLFRKTKSLFLSVFPLSPPGLRLRAAAHGWVTWKCARRSRETFCRCSAELWFIAVLMPCLCHSRLKPLASRKIARPLACLWQKSQRHGASSANN